MSSRSGKILIFLWMFLLSISLGSAAGWGVITQNTDAEISSLERNYTLGLVNTGSRAVELSLSSSQSPDYDIEFEDPNILLEPSTTTKSPEGSNWFYSGGGEYTNVTYTSFSFQASDDRSSNDLNFQIFVSERSNLNPLTQNIPRQAMISQRRFDYQMEIDKTLVRGLNQGPDSSEDDSVEEDSTDEQAQESDSVSNSTQSDGSNSHGQKNKDEKQDDINVTTMALGLLLISTVIYLFR